MSPIIDSLGLVKGYGWGSVPSSSLIDRGLFFGGGNASQVSTIDYVTISTTGNAINFGNLTASRSSIGASGNGTRTIAVGGQEGGTQTTKIEYVSPATTGNAITFGSAAKRSAAYVVGNDTIVVAGGGYNDTGGGWITSVEYVTIATTGNATSWGATLDFGAGGGAASGSTTRGVFHAGSKSGTYNDKHWYVTFATTGVVNSFGNDTGRQQIFGGSSNTRSVYGAGRGPDSSQPASVRYLTIATTGSFASFGSLSQQGTYWYGPTGASNGTRVLAAGGQAGEASTWFNYIEHMTIATTGNGVDFGDLTSARNTSGASGAHGGLSR